MNLPTQDIPETLTDRISPRLVPAELVGLEPWRVVRHLGSGATAHVWLLEDHKAGVLVACKTPRTPEDRIVLSQEAKLSDGLRHENIVQSRADLVPELAKRGTVTCWEFLPAGSLQALISAVGSISTAQTVTVLLAMIDVAGYLHTQQIVHGDISPANILFDVSGRPVLIDLGSVRATAHCFHYQGTPGFVAPEVAATDGRIQGLGASADVYSLAAIGWLCLTSSPPGTPYARMPLLTLRPDLDPEIAEIVEACLAEVPSQRPSLDQLRAAVATWAVPEPVDLFASAGETVELQLPTRPRASSAANKKRRRRGSRRFQRGATAGEDSGRPQYRALLMAGVLMLTAGAAATAVYAPMSEQQVAVSQPVGPQSAESPDVQSILDSLARSRGAAWAESDAALVKDYAVEESAIYAEDVRMLSVLSDGAMQLQGIRMRAVTESVETTAEGMELIVEWHTDGYQQVTATGDVIQHVEARVDQLALEIVETSVGWRLNAVKAI